MTFGHGVRESGIHALHSAGMRCRRAAALVETNTTMRGRPNDRSLPLGFMVTLSRLGAGFQPAVRYGSRTRDSQVNSLVL